MTSAVAGSIRDLRPIFDPRSIAVVGASGDPSKWGYWLTRGALRGELRREVALINRRGEPVLGRETHRSLAELADPPELVVTAVPLSGFDTVVDQALEAGTKAIIAINAGFAELGGDGVERQRELVRRVREAGAMLVGPNCLGIMDNETELEAAWLPVGGDGIAPGPIAVVTQSGNLGLDLMVLARERSLGISRFVSIGNQGDVSAAEILLDLARHESTRIIAVYVEDVSDGRALFAAARSAIEAGKHVLVVAAGGSEASAAAARGHTGALTSPAEIVDAAAEAVGAIKVATLEELVDVAQVLLHCGTAVGRRVAVVSDGGGHSVLGADVASAAGLAVPRFSDALRDQLAAEIPSAPATGNPVDLGGAIEPTMFERAVDVVCASGEVDGVLVVGGYAQWPELDPELGAVEEESATRMGRRVGERGVPLLVQTFFTGTSTAEALRAAGIPVYRTMGAAVSAYARVLRAAEAPPSEIVPLEHRERHWGSARGARELLREAGVAFPEHHVIITAAAAVDSAESIGYPVALKASDLLHKSDSGGVALDLDSPDAVRAAASRMIEKGLSTRFTVERMVDRADGVELLVGCRRDRRFGPVVTVGLGGIYAEILADTAHALAPCTEATALGLLNRLRGAPMLHGARGAPACDLESAARVVAQLSEVAAREPWIDAIEINPLLVTASGSVALDARVLPLPSGEVL